MKKILFSLSLLFLAATAFAAPPWYVYTDGAGKTKAYLHGDMRITDTNGIIVLADGTTLYTTIQFPTTAQFNTLELTVANIQIDTGTLLGITNQHTSQIAALESNTSNYFLVKVSSEDTTQRYLNAKIRAGVGVNISTENAGGDEYLNVATLGAAGQSNYYGRNELLPSGYYVMSTTFSTTGFSTFTVTSIASGEVFLSSFTTLPNYPNATSITGPIDCHLYALKSGLKTIQVYAKFYKRTTGDVLTQLGSNTGYSGEITSTVDDYNFDSYVDTTLDSTDRIVGTIWAHVTGAASATDLNLYFEGSRASHISLPTPQIVSHPQLQNLGLGISGHPYDTSGAFASYNSVLTVQYSTFTKASIDHTGIQNIGTQTHDQLESRLGSVENNISGNPQSIYTVNFSTGDYYENVDTTTALGSISMSSTGNNLNTGNIPITGWQYIDQGVSSVLLRQKFHLNYNFIISSITIYANANNRKANVRIADSEMNYIYWSSSFTVGAYDYYTVTLSSALSAYATYYFVWNKNTGDSLDSMGTAATGDAYMQGWNGSSWQDYNYYGLMYMYFNLHGYKPSATYRTTISSSNISGYQFLGQLNTTSSYFLPGSSIAYRIQPRSSYGDNTMPWESITSGYAVNYSSPAFGFEIDFTRNVSTAVPSVSSAYFKINYAPPLLGLGTTNQWSGGNAFSSFTATNANLPNGLLTGGKHWEVIASSVIVSAVTNMTVSGLNSNTDIEYFIEGVLFTGGASAPIYSLQMSTSGAIIDTTARYSWLNARVSDVPADSPDRGSNQTGIEFGRNTTTTNQACNFEGHIRIATVKYYTGKSLCVATNAGTSEFLVNGGGHWNSTTGAITAINIVASQTGGIGVGSYINVWARR